MALLASMALPTFSQNNCAYVITMYDSYGDGWGGSRGSFVYVMQGNTPVDTFRVHRTGSHNDFIEIDTLWMQSGMEYSFFWKSGEDARHDYECSFLIHDLQGNRVCQCPDATLLPVGNAFQTLQCGDVCFATYYMGYSFEGTTFGDENPQMFYYNVDCPYIIDTLQICDNQTLMLYDDGGPLNSITYSYDHHNMGKYFNSAVVLYSDSPNKMLKLSGLYNFYDLPWMLTDVRLRVFDGTDTTGQLLFSSTLDSAEVPEIVSLTGALTVLYQYQFMDGIQWFEPSSPYYAQGFELEVSLTSPILCYSPVNLTLENETADTLTFAWTTVGTATEWEMEFGPAGFAHGSGTVVTVNSNPCKITSFPHGEIVDFYIRTKCGDSQYSSWSNKVQRFTPGYYVIPENGTDTISLCGGHLYLEEYLYTVNTTVVIVPDNPQQLVQLSGSYSWSFFDPSFVLNIYDGASIEGTSLLYTSEGTSDGNIGVVTSTSGPLTLQLSGYAYQVEDFNFFVQCINYHMPIHFRVDSVGPFAARLVWTEVGTATEWDVEYGAEGFTFGTGTQLHVTDTFCTVTGIAIGSVNDFYVRSNSGQGQTGDWAGPVTYFSTSATPATFTVPLNQAYAARMCEGTAHYENTTGNAASTLLTLFPKTANAYISVQSPPNYPIRVFEGTDTLGTILAASNGYLSESGPLTIVTDCNSGDSFDISISCDACPTPDSLRIVRVSGDSATLVWHDHNASNSWVVSCCLNGHHPGNVYTVTEPRVTVSGLQEGSTYTMEVYALCGNGLQSGWPTLTYIHSPDEYDLSQDADEVGICGGQVTHHSGWTTANNRKTVILMPMHEGEYLQLQGTLRQEYDQGIGFRLLTVYDGMGTAGTILYQSPTDGFGGAVDVSDTIFIQSITGPLTLATNEYGYSQLQFLPDNHFSLTASCTDCAIPAGLRIDSLSPYSITLAWEETGAVTSWDIEYGLSGFTPGTGAGTLLHVTTNPYTVQNIFAAGVYDFYVRSHCSDISQSVFVGPISHRFLTNGFIPIAEGRHTISLCGGHLYDDGGPDGDYSRICHTEVTLMPETTGEYVQVQGFCEIGCHDTLRIFDGIGAEGELLYALYSELDPYGNCFPFINIADIPKVVSASGPLTVQLIKDYYYNNPGSGFDMEVQCIACRKPVGFVASSGTDSSVTLNWTDVTPAESWEVEYGPVGFILGTGITVTANAHPITVQSLPTGSYDFYVRARCDSTNVSDPAGPLTFVSVVSVDGQITLPLCGDHLYDNGGPNENYSGPNHTVITLIPDEQGRYVRIQGGYNLSYPDNIKVYDGLSTDGLLLAEMWGHYPEIWSWSDIIVQSISGPLTLEMVTENPNGSPGFDFDVSCVDCPVAANFALTDSTDTTFTLSWWAESTDAEWEIEYVRHDVPRGEGVVAHTYAHSYTYHEEDMPAGETILDFYLHARCDSSNQLWIGPFVVMIPGRYSFMNAARWDTISICGQHLYDPAGPFDYCWIENYESIMVTLMPDAPGNFVQIQGSYGSAWDPLRIYDGADTNGILLFENSFVEGTIPTLQSITGPLTIQVVPFEGLITCEFDLNVNCSSCTPPDDFRATTYSTGEVVLTWASSGDTTALHEIEYGSPGFIHGYGTTIITFDNPYVLTGLEVGTYEFYSRRVCDSIERSIWGDSQTLTVGQYNIHPNKTQTLQKCGEHISFDNHSQEYTTLVIISEEENNYVHLSGSFSLHNRYNIGDAPSAIRIFDGPDTTSALLYENHYINDGVGSDVNGSLILETTSNTMTVLFEENVSVNFDVRCVSCWRPENLTAVSKNDSIISVSWTEVGHATSWELYYYEYGVDGSYKGDSTMTVYSTQIDLNIGVGGHLYYFRVYSVCDDNTTNESDLVSVVVPPNIYSDTYYQFGKVVHWFGNAHLHMCGGHIYGPYNKNNPSGMTYEVTVFPNSPDALVHLDGIFSQYDGNPAVLPPPDYLKIYDGIGTDGTLLFYSYPVNPGYVTVTSSTGPLTIQMYNYWSYINIPPFDFQVSCIPAPSCFVPTALKVDSFKDTAVTLSWVENGEASVWEVEYGEEGHAPGTGDIVQTTANPFILCGLQPGTTYEVYVRSVCHSGETSPWTGPVTVVANSYVANHSGTDILTLCGGHLYDEGGSYGYHHTAEIDNVIVLLPDQPGDYVKVEGWTNMSGVFRIYDGADTNGRLLATAEKDMVVSVQSSTGPLTVHVVTSFEEGQLFRVFDLAVSCVSCLVPKDFRVIDDTYWYDTLSMSWSESGSATQWDIQYGSDGFVLGTGSVITTTDNPHTFQYLTPGVDYSFYVRSNCGGNNTSAWAGPVHAMPQAYYIPNFGRRTLTLCEGVLYDDGGPNRSYAEDGDVVVTLRPAEEGEAMRVFGYWYQNAYTNGQDYLQIYDGKDTVYPVLYDTRLHSNPIMATSSMGPLTLYFHSTRPQDMSNFWSGFELHTDCVETDLFVPCSSPTWITLSDITLHSAVVDWIQDGPDPDFWVVNYTNSDTWKSAVTSTHPYILRNLDEHTTYRVNVEAHCEDGYYGNVSEEVTFFTSPSGVQEYAADGDILLYPNPTRGTVTVRHNSLIQHIALYDVYGKVLYEAPVDDCRAVLDLQPYASGMYFVRAKTSDGVSVRSVVKE